MDATEFRRRAHRHRWSFLDGATSNDQRCGDCRPQLARRDLELSISTRWFIPQERAPLAIHDDAPLRSLADYPIPLDEHLDSHRAVRNLISLVFATPIHYRGHELTLPSFAPAPFAPREDPVTPPS